MESLARDIGIEAWAIQGFSREGIGHMYVLVRQGKRYKVVDYSRIMDEHDGLTTYEHRLFRDAKYEGRVITEQGGAFLDFMDYRTDSSRLHRSIKAHKPLEVRLGTHEQSVRLQSDELYCKAGIAGKSELFEFGQFFESELGYSRLGLFGGTCDGENMYGWIIEVLDMHRPETGWSYRHHFSYVEARTAADGFQLFGDLRLGLEAGYQLDGIRPWASCQANVFEREIGRADDYAVFMTEYAVGCELKLNGFTIDPYLLKTLQRTSVGVYLGYSWQWLTIAGKVDGDVEVSARADMEDWQVTIGYREERTTLTIGRTF